MSGENGARRNGRRPPAARRARTRTAEQPSPPHLRPAPPPARSRPPAADRARADLASVGHPHVAPHTAPPAAAVPARRADAGALAAAFGVDFLSWDEGDPERRGRALAPYAVPPVRQERLTAAGWPGSGRQRGELALPGAVIALAEDRLLVHVRVRVTPFRRLTSRPVGVRQSTDVLPYPAAAPAPTDPAWVGLDSYWYELLVPVRDLTGQWRVDIAAVVVVPPLPLGPRDGVGAP